MTAKADFTEDEWKTIATGPTSAGMVVATASRGGTFRESFSMAKAYTEARGQHGESQLLDELVNSKPQMDKTREHSYEELKAHNLETVRNAVALLEGKATPEEVDEYRKFVRGLAQRVAEAHSEHGEAVSPEEQQALADIDATLGSAPTG